MKYLEIDGAGNTSGEDGIKVNFEQSDVHFTLDAQSDPKPSARQLAAGAH